MRFFPNKLDHPILSDLFQCQQSNRMRFNHFRSIIRLFFTLSGLLLLSLSLSGCGDSFPSQKEGEKLAEKYVKAYLTWDFDKVWDMIPHEERTAIVEKWLRVEVEITAERIKELGEFKKLEAKETKILENTADGPTRLEIHYNLHLKDKQKGTTRIMVFVANNQWYASPLDLAWALPKPPKK